MNIGLPGGKEKRGGGQKTVSKKKKEYKRGKVKIRRGWRIGQAGDRKKVLTPASSQDLHLRGGPRGEANQGRRRRILQSAPSYQESKKKKTGGRKGCARSSTRKMSKKGMERGDELAGEKWDGERCCAGFLEKGQPKLDSKPTCRAGCRSAPAKSSKQKHKTKENPHGEKEEQALWRGSEAWGREKGDRARWPPSAVEGDFLEGSERK